jgi:D-3-phosphoglycerate dehydrogenase
MLNGRALGLIGCGRIGSWMARYARAFNMRIEGHDPHLAVMPQGVRRVPLPELMATSDAVSVHVPLTLETRGLVSAELLARIKPGAIFVNTSRGAVVDEGALLEGLKSGRIGAAGLDVLDGEPVISNHPLLGYAQTHDNLLITPHCGGFSPDAVARVAGHAAGVALEFLSRNERP